MKNDKKNSFISLPSIPLNLILTFLYPNTIYCSLSLTCKAIFYYIKISDYLTSEIPKQCLGLSDCFQIPKGYDSIELLKSLKNFDQLKEIPFYGYFTDGGMDQNKTEYWVNRIFTRGNWSICSRSGQNIHVIGGLLKYQENISNDMVIFREIFKLSQGLFEEKSFLYKFFSCFKRRPTEIEMYFRERMFRMMLTMNKELIFELLQNNREKIHNNPIFKNYSTAEIISRLENFERRCEIPIENITFINDYVLREKNIELETKKIAIIRGVEISRNGYFTCPVKTLMVFVSEEEINYEVDQELKIFNDCSNCHELKSVLKKHGLINNVKLSNINSFVDLSDIQEKESYYQLVIFRNNIKKKVLGKFKPVLWISFEDPNSYSVCVKFPKTNCFAGSHVLVKMIDCEKKEVEENDFNIDINYIVFMGNIIEF